MSKWLASSVLCTFAALSYAQSVQKPSPRLGRADEVLPWSRFRPRTEPYKPAEAEKRQIETKLGELDKIIGDLKAHGTDDQLLAEAWHPSVTPPSPVGLDPAKEVRVVERGHYGRG